MDGSAEALQGLRGVRPQILHVFDATAVPDEVVDVPGEVVLDAVLAFFSSP